MNWGLTCGWCLYYLVSCVSWSSQSQQQVNDGGGWASMGVQQICSFRLYIYNIVFVKLLPRQYWGMFCRSNCSNFKERICLFFIYIRFLNVTFQYPIYFPIHPISSSQTFLKLFLITEVFILSWYYWQTMFYFVGVTPKSETLWVSCLVIPALYISSHWLWNWYFQHLC